ncbi:MAG TPA: signal peptidase II [Planctomicrobium sp.]|nr:signal peptidase II [Planctomicrobium sp.]
MPLWQTIVSLFLNLTQSDKVVCITMTELAPPTQPAPSSSAEKPTPARRFLSRGSRIRSLALLILVIVGLDQASKAHAVYHWKGQPPQIFFNDLFRIEYAENHGAFLSLLANTPPEVRFWVLTVSNGIVLLGLAIGLIVPRRMELMSYLPLALVVAGGLGNLIDRVRFRYVIDFLNLGIGDLRTGIFNVADMAISAGFLLIIPLLFRKEPQPAVEKTESTEKVANVS